MIEGGKTKIPRHEFDHRTQARHRGANGQTSEAGFGDRRIDNAFGTELFKQAFSHFVSAVVLRDFFTHDENIRVAFHFFVQRLA